MFGTIIPMILLILPIARFADVISQERQRSYLLDYMYAENFMFN